MGPSQSLILALTLVTFLTRTSSSDYTTLVFKGCADKNFQDFNALHRQTIKHLLDTLITQSSAAKFYNTTSDGGAAAVDGLFQCRGDLSNGDCETCVAKASSMASKLCKQAIAARIQLNGCYIGYQISGFRQAGRTDLLYRICGSDRASGSGFGDRLDVALGGIVKGLESGNNVGFYAGGYQSVYVLGQCEGDLSGGDCVDCVKNAIDRAKSECGSSISAQLYFQECYISYTYYPNGVKSNQKSLSSSGTGKSTQKTVAIVMGGLVGLGLVMSCLLYTKSAFKKKTHHTNYKYGG
ncbi:cysteine-rich repeat secretory protein 3 [Phtheirospermum japonicum]|uniref:Cysteine-rich repeat secretory protein 3 n=1 Tax=Phtheirospermum japonicum TaxID=374723 RepID=A0A830BEM8_9LAMI|nr:cysteine-rich repeat secretory protein 3 [Phtheirospermum japonicum]